VKVNPAGETIPNMGAAPYADTASSGNNTNSGNTTSGSNTNNNLTQQYQISDSEKELNYMMDMMFMNGAGSSTDPSVQMAYEWVSNPDNKGEAIPQEVQDAFYAFMGNINDDQIARSNQIAVGKDDEIGLVGKIYEAKAAGQKTTIDAAGDSESTHNLDDDSVKKYKWGEAGRFTLGEIFKQDAKIFGENSDILYEAYSAGRHGMDLTEEIIASARAGGFLDEIETMYKAGETDLKITTEVWPAEGDHERAKKIVTDNAQYIINAAEEFDIDPVWIAMVIYAEQALNHNAKDWFDILGATGLVDTSVGVGQVRISTAKFIEEEGYMPETKGQCQSSKITWKLGNKEGNIRYVAAYIKYFIDLWSEVYPEITQRPDIIATLFNVGHQKTSPNANPESNEFGDYAEIAYNYLKRIFDVEMQKKYVGGQLHEEEYLQ